MFWKSYQRVFIWIIIPFLLAGSAWAQAGRGKGRLSGLVVDENQNSIPSAKIVCEFIENMELKKETTSDNKGEWAILGLGTGMWRVTASKGGYIPQFFEVHVRQLQRNPKVNLTLKKIEGEGAVLKNQDSLNMLEQANVLFKEQKYDEAVSLMQQFLEQNPEAYQAYASIGDCYREKGDFDPAIENYNIVLEKAKTDDSMRKEMTARALAGIGECYLEMQDFEKAQSYFEQSIEAYPENEILAYNVGEIYFSNQKIDEAIQYFTISTQVMPDWPPPYLKLGYVYLNKGDYGNAEVNFKKFLEMNPNSPEAPTVQNILDYIAKIK
jgi:tetratricopeptide (TPR) repeat protein